MPKSEWFIGDRVYVPRITTDETVELTISDLGPDDEDDPDVRLLLKEIRPVRGSNTKSEFIRDQFRFAKFSELEDVPVRRTKGGALRRRVRNMTPVPCECGCGQETSGTMFLQGHDAKLKSRLKKVMDGRIEDDPKYTVESAEDELIQRGWI